MAKRRQLPAPPLVLTPYLGRFSENTTRALKLLRLARFLNQRGLLTDGGVKSLEGELKGRNQVVGLGLQDVRAWAHGLAVELLQAEPEAWDHITKRYFSSYDKGKPRRPTHLQRLYMEWSRDLAWTGLLTACAGHPRLWCELERALERLEEECLEGEMLGLALQCRDDHQKWIRAFESTDSRKQPLLTLLPLLPTATPGWRVPYLASYVKRYSLSSGLTWTLDLLKACHCTPAQARSLSVLSFPREALESLALGWLQQDPFDPMFVSSFRAYVVNPSAVHALLHAIPIDDPLRRVAFGPRPGTNWLQSIEDELLSLIELR